MRQNIFLQDDSNEELQNVSVSKFQQVYLPHIFKVSLVSFLSHTMRLLCHCHECVFVTQSFLSLSQALAQQAACGAAQHQESHSSYTIRSAVTACRLTQSRVSTHLQSYSHSDNLGKHNTLTHTQQSVGDSEPESQSLGLQVWETARGARESSASYKKGSPDPGRQQGRAPSGRCQGRPAWCGAARWHVELSCLRSGLEPASVTPGKRGTPPFWVS